MTLGAAFFLIIAIVVANVLAPGNSPSPPLLTYVAIATAMILLAARAIVPGLVVARCLTGANLFASPTPPTPEVTPRG